MGAKQSKSKSNMNGGSDENATINWNNLNTDEFSSDIPYLTKMDKDVKSLVSNLKLPETDSMVHNSDVDSIFEKIYNKITDTNNSSYNSENLNTETNLTESLNNTSVVDLGETENYSSTSPFISSDMYNNMLDRSSSIDSTLIQAGGAGEETSTTYTGSTVVSETPNKEQATESATPNLSSSMDVNDGTTNDKPSETSVSPEQQESVTPVPAMANPDEDEVESNTAVTEEKTISPENVIASVFSPALPNPNPNQTGGYGPIDNEYYMSSSAHTEGDSSVIESTISMGNNKLLSDSINTSDINMVSVE
jgi:hypothetical protein